VFCARLRFFQLGVTLLFGGLFLKSWRLHRIFFGNLLQRDSNARLLLMLGGFVSFDLVCRLDRVQVLYRSSYSLLCVHHQVCLSLMTWLGQIHVESVYRPLCVPVLDPDHNHELGRSVMTFIMDGTKRESPCFPAFCLELTLSGCCIADSGHHVLGPVPDGTTLVLQCAIACSLLTSLMKHCTAATAQDSGSVPRVLERDGHVRQRGAVRRRAGHAALLH
jgi:hypothetical protein